MISYRTIFNDYSRDEEYKFYCQFQHQHYYNNVFVKILPDEESHYERFPGGAAPWLTPRRGCIATLSQQTPSSRSRSSPGPGCRTSSGIIGGRSLYGDWFTTALFELGTGVRVVSGWQRIKCSSDHWRSWGGNDQNGCSLVSTMSDTFFVPSGPTRNVTFCVKVFCQKNK